MTVTKNAITITALTDTEFDTLQAMIWKAEDKYFNSVCGWRTAFRNILQWCARRNITEQTFWDWLND